MREKPPRDEPMQAGGDPWAAFGYLVAGVGLYGLLGWGLGVWLNASYLTPVGILFGAVLGLVLVYLRFGRSTGAESNTKQASSGPDQAPPGHSTDDRGETE